MKNNIKKILSLTLGALIFVLALATPISALSFRKGTNTASTAYSSSEYYEKLTSLSLTGDNRTDLLAVALSQLGYTEGNQNGAFGGNENGTQNFTEYNYNMGSFGAGYGGKDYPWCASFVSFCLLQSGAHNQTRISDWCRKNEGDANYIWREVSCNRWAKQLRTCGYFKDSARFGGDYLPLPGDLIYFTEDGKLESHIGIVLYSDGELVYTVEGNTSSATGLESNGGGVYTKSYPLSSAYIRGYGVLPYKVNNSIYHIDYSGAHPTAGIYVSTTDKCIYPTENASTYNHVLPKYSFFEVTDVAENGRLKALCEIDGTLVEGYIKNNSDRVIQLSSKESPSHYSTLERAWGYKRSCIDCYLLGDTSFYTRPNEESITISNDIAICGSAALTREIDAFGYYFDENRTDIIWDKDAVIVGESLDVTYKIAAKTDTLSAGKHDIHFVLMLSDKTICEIDALSFTAKKGNGTVPDEPTLHKFTDDSITLVSKAGYEYKLGEGKWQSSPVFEGLWQNTPEPYRFYQRIAETDTTMPSKESPALLLDLGALCNSTKLTSLSLSEANLSPEFGPDLTEYTAKVAYSVKKVTPEAVAREGATVKIDAPELEAGKYTDIKITVSAQFGSPRVYKIKVFREEEVTTHLPETEPPTEATETAETSETLDTVANTVTDTDTDTSTDVAKIPSASELGCEGTLSFACAALVALIGLGTAFVRKKD